MQKSFYRNLSLIFCLLSVFPLSAQDSTDYSESEDIEESHSSFVNFQVMMVSPSRSLSSETELFSPNIIQGAGFKAEGAWLFHRNIGIGGSLTYQNLNKVSELKFDAFEYWSQFQGDGQWNNLVLMGGLFFSKPFTSFAIDAKILTGYGHTWAFDKKMIYRGGPLGDFNRLVDYSGGSLWWNTGVNFRMDFGPGWSLGAGYDYYFSQRTIRFTDVTEGSNPQVETQSKNGLFYGFHCINLGITYNFTHYVKTK